MKSITAKTALTLSLLCWAVPLKAFSESRASGRVLNIYPETLNSSRDRSREILQSVFERGRLVRPAAAAAVPIGAETKRSAPAIPACECFRSADRDVPRARRPDRAAGSKASRGRPSIPANIAFAIVAVTMVCLLFPQASPALGMAVVLLFHHDFAEKFIRKKGE